MLRAIQSLPTDLGRARLSSYRLAAPARPRPARPPGPGRVAARADRRLTFGELDERAGRFASGLRGRRGWSRATGSSSLLPNSVRLFEMLVGLRAGRRGHRAGQLAAVRPRARRGDRGRRPAPSSSATRRCCDRHPPTAHRTPPDRVGARLRDLARGVRARRRSDSATPDDVVLQIYTSGTSGRPKGVLLTDGNLAAKVTGVMRPVGSRAEASTSLLATPLFHVGRARAGAWSGWPPARRRSSPTTPTRPRSLRAPARRTGDPRVPGAVDAARRCAPRGRRSVGVPRTCARSSTAPRRSATRDVGRGDNAFRAGAARRSTG